MKRILLLLSLLLASPALADDAVTSFGWNSVTGTFQAMTRALGWKNIPDSATGSFSATFTGPRSLTDTVVWNRVGNVVTLYLPNETAACSTANSGFTAASATLPAAITPARTQDAVFGVLSGSTYSYSGQWQVSTSGGMTVCGSLQSCGFATSGNCGWVMQTVTYILN